MNFTLGEPAATEGLQRGVCCDPLDGRCDNTGVRSEVGSGGNKKKATDVTSNKIWLSSPLAGQESSFIGNCKST